MNKVEKGQKAVYTSSYTTGGVHTVTGWIQRNGYQQRLARDCEITLEPRPAYCDRGNFIAKLFPNGVLVQDLDGWPRYYFDEARAKAEIEAWLRKRGAVVKKPRAAQRNTRSD